MVDLSSITNEKLRNLIAGSAKFSALSQAKQLAHIERIKHLPSDRQDRLCKFFTDENLKEKTKPKNLSGEEKLMILEQLYNELVDLEHKFTQLLRQETEVKDREHEGHEMNQLLNQLNHN